MNVLARPISSGLRPSRTSRHDCHRDEFDAYRSPVLAEDSEDKSRRFICGSARVRRTEQSRSSRRRRLAISIRIRASDTVPLRGSGQSSKVVCVPAISSRDIRVGLLQRSWIAMRSPWFMPLPISRNAGPLCLSIHGTISIRRYICGLRSLQRSGCV